MGLVLSSKNQPIAATQRVADAVHCLFIAALVFLIPIHTFAQPEIPDTSPQDLFDITIYIENDGAFLRPWSDTDRYYTSGVGISAAWQPDFADGFNDALFDADQFDRTGFGMLAQHRIYTPENLATAALIPNDQPYAGYMAIGGYFQRANDTTMDHAQLDLGVVGPSALGRQAQQNVHSLVGGDDVNGWDNQIPDEFHFQFTLRRKGKFALGTFDLGGTEIEVEALPQVALNVGTVNRDVEFGGYLRFGPNLPADFGPALLFDPDDATLSKPRTENGVLNVYGFAGAFGRVVEHNVFHEGGQWHDEPAGIGVDSETFVGTFSGGLAASYRWDSFELSVIWNQRVSTDEFEGQRGTAGVGALNFGMRWGF